MREFLKQYREEKKEERDFNSLNSSEEKQIAKEVFEEAREDLKSIGIMAFISLFALSIVIIGLLLLKPKLSIDIDHIIHRFESILGIQEPVSNPASNENGNDSVSEENNNANNDSSEHGGQSSSNLSLDCTKPFDARYHGDYIFQGNSYSVDVAFMSDSSFTSLTNNEDAILGAYSIRDSQIHIVSIDNQVYYFQISSDCRHVSKIEDGVEVVLNIVS